MSTDRVKSKMARGTLVRKAVFGRDDMLATIEIAAPAGENVFSFQAGQYATIGVDVGDKFVPRPYSIASCPENRTRLEFYLALVATGALTPALWALKEGDPIWYMKGAKGHFTLDGIAAPNLVMVGTGTGLAPFLSMLRSLWIDHKAGKRHGRTLTLMHGVRFLDDLGYREELTGMASDPSFGLAYMPTVSRPESGAGTDPGVATGRVNDVFRAMLGEAPDGKVQPRFARTLPAEALLKRMPPASSALLLCGNPAMGADVKTIGDKHGFGLIKTEDYW